MEALPTQNFSKPPPSNVRHAVPCVAARCPKMRKLTCMRNRNGGIPKEKSGGGTMTNKPQIFYLMDQYVVTKADAGKIVMAYHTDFFEYRRRL